MKKEDMEVLDEIIAQGEYQLKEGGYANGLVPVYVNAEDLMKLRAIRDELLGGSSRMTKAECRAVAESLCRLCPSLPAVREISEARQKAIAWAKKTRGEISFDELFRRVEASDFLTGRASGWRGCGFDWVLKKANLLKILEGNYDNKKAAVKEEASFELDDFFAAAVKRTERVAVYGNV